MERPRIALVCPDASRRVAAAAAFDGAPLEWEVTLHAERPAHADVVVGVGDPVDCDLYLDPERPADVISQIGSLLSAATARVVAVVGASGGCGATSVALHLAARAGRRSCVADLHAPPGCALRLGLAAEELPEPGLPVPVSGGFGLTRIDPSSAPELIPRLRLDHRSVIVDCPSASIDAVIGGCDAVVLVMTPTAGSAARAAGLLAVVDDVPTAVVTNRVGPGGETTRAELQRILGRRVTIELPCSPGLRDSEDDARLMTSPWSPWLRRVVRLSAALFP